MRKFFLMMWLLLSDVVWGANDFIPEMPLPRDLTTYPPSSGSLLEDLMQRASADPLNWISALIFFCAIIHTFLSPKILAWSHHVQEEYTRKRIASGIATEDEEEHSLFAQVLHYLGELEAVFLIWTVPLFWAIVSLRGWQDAIFYTSHKVNYTEPLFVVIIMIIAATKPILNFSENTLRLLAKMGKESTFAWWFVILVFAPALGSFITEPAAITIAALLLSRKFFALQPSNKFKYATLGLLFTNISVGGTITHFAAPPVLMVAGPWGWDMSHMMLNFGWKAFIGVIFATVIYSLFFVGEFKRCDEYARAQRLNDKDEVLNSESSVPFWITAIHIFTLAWTVIHAHNPALFIIGFLFFIAFVNSTAKFQSPLTLKTPILVGVFLAGLVTHGGLQGWWIAPVLQSMSELPLFVSSIVLTAFNDNAAITYLSTLVPNFSESLKYAVVAGAVTGGGLTVIANAPNPAGQGILSQFFKDRVVLPQYLFLGALFPTIVLACCFWFL